MSNENKTLSWTAPEYEFKEKTNDWFWAVIIIVASGGIASIIFKNYLFAVFLILASGLLMYYNIHKPEIITFEINEKGLKIKDEQVNFKDMINYWIDKNHPHKRLLINTKNFLAPHLDILIPDTIREEDLKVLFLDKVTEHEIKEPIAHKFIEYLGF